MIQNLKFLTLAAALAVGGTMSASAATLDLTNSGSYDISQTESLASGTIVGVTWQLTSGTDSPLTYTAYDGGAPQAGFASQIDGVGIKDDEVTAPGEYLELTFSQHVEISGFYFLDLFTSDLGTEQALVTLLDGVTEIGTFSATSVLGASNGFLAAVTGAVWTTGLRFYATGTSAGDDGSRDYALAGVEISAVPLPAGGVLLLTALGGLAAARRRKSV